MKKLALACALGMALCANAAADDMHGAATHDWSGHFIGLHGGGAWGDTQTVQGVLTTGDYSLDGAFGGWTSGANWQSGNWVWGYESDTSFGDIDGSTPSSCSGSCYAEVNWFSTIRGRLGYARGMFLFYATAGLAYGEVEGGISAGAPPERSDDINAGLAIGGGVEMAFNENWSAKIEYLHIDLGDTSAPGGGTPIVTDFSDINIVRVGVKRKFDLFGYLTGMAR